MITRIPPLIQEIPPDAQVIRGTFIQNYTRLTSEGFRLHRIRTTFQDEHLMTYACWDPSRQMWWKQTSDGVYIWEAPPPVCNIAEAQTRICDLLREKGFATIKFGSCVPRYEAGRGVYFVLFCDYPRKRFIVFEDGTVTNAQPHNHPKIW